MVNGSNIMAKNNMPKTKRGRRALGAYGGASMGVAGVAAPAFGVASAAGLGALAIYGAKKAGEKRIDQRVKRSANRADAQMARLRKQRGNTKVSKRISRATQENPMPKRVQMSGLPKKTAAKRANIEVAKMWRRVGL